MSDELDADGKPAWKARVGAMIYWLLACIALLVIASSQFNNRMGMDIGQVLAGAVLYAIGRDMRRVLRE
jgi:hypothetical protein